MRCASSTAGALLLFLTPAQAQSTIVGRITDTRSAQPIGGVTLRLEGTTLGAMSGTEYQRVDGIVENFVPAPAGGHRDKREIIGSVAVERLARC